jgi:hypothetical protein
MEEVASTPKLVDSAAGGAKGALTATLPRLQIESALQDDAGADLFLEIARIQNGERDDRTVKVAWERSDLEELLQRSTGDRITLTFDEAELQRLLDEDVEAHGLREKALVLTVAVATAAGIAGNAAAQMTADGGTSSTPAAAVSGLVTDNSPLAAADSVSSVPADGWMSGVESPVASPSVPADGWMSGVESPVAADPTGISQPGDAPAFITDTGAESTRTPAPSVGGGGGSGFTVPDSAIEAALAGGLALLITGAALVTRTQRRRESPA